MGGGYFQREDPRDWEPWDGGVKRFYLYVLEINRPPFRYVGQTKNLRRRLRAHADGAVKTTADAAVELVYVVEVPTREEATRYEWFLKRMQRECPDQVGWLIRQGRKETRRVLDRAEVPRELRRWKEAGPARGIVEQWAWPSASASSSKPGRRSPSFSVNSSTGPGSSGVRWWMVALVSILLFWVFQPALFDEGSDGNETQVERVVKEEVGRPKNREREDVLVEDSGVVRDRGRERGASEVPGGVVEPVQGGEKTDLDADAMPDDQAEEEPEDTAAAPGAPMLAKTERAPVGGAVREPIRTVYVEPVYPEIARRARVSGTVILEARIDPNGNVINTEVLRSIPLLDQAAIDAVRQWKYEPALLHGVPVPIVVTVTVIFEKR